MSRHRLKCGGRRKAIFGADGAIMAAATLAAAGITAGATAAAAKSQAKAVVESAKTQAQSIRDQSANNTQLQKDSMSFTKQQNAENRQQQQDIQTTLQMLAGQENMNDRMEASKVAVKFGGRPKRSLRSFYGGGRQPFTVTDGGGAIPVAVNPAGYGLYEIYGNDHDHYHKAPGGKNKTGVGFKFPDGSVVEGEGNQNSNQGEYMYVTPNDAMFISKHSINGFNPAQAVNAGMHPVQAFAVQEQIKADNGLNDDGSRKKSLKRSFGGQQILNDTANITYLPSNGAVDVAGGAAYIVNNPSSPVENNMIARNGKRVSLKRCGGSRRRADWGTYAGSTYNAAGNLLGAGINVWGNMYAGKKLGEAYGQAGQILADAYGQLQTIDESFLNRENFSAPHAMAVVRSASTNINPQLERIRRDAASQRREVNRGTMSSAARQQRLAGIDDRAFQRAGEQYAWKENQDEQIRQGNAERITNVAQQNADRDVQANRDYTNARLSLKQYNNNIVNQRIAGAAQAQADALTQSASANATAFQSSMNAIGSAVQASGQGFASAFDANRKYQMDRANTLIGADTERQVLAAIQTGNSREAQGIYTAMKGIVSAGNDKDGSAQKYMNMLKAKYPTLS